MHVVKCAKCGRLNQVQPVRRAEVNNLRCVRCEEPLPVDPALVIPEPKRIKPVEVMLGLLGVLFWPAGVVLTSLLMLRPAVVERYHVKLGYAWAMMGMVLHLVLFVVWPPMHSFYVQFWTRLASLPHLGP